jgi:hypothetical protein
MTTLFLAIVVGALIHVEGYPVRGYSLMLLVDRNPVIQDMRRGFGDAAERIHELYPAKLNVDLQS